MRFGQKREPISKFPPFTRESWLSPANNRACTHFGVLYVLRLCDAIANLYDALHVDLRNRTAERVKMRCYVLWTFAEKALEGGLRQTIFQSTVTAGVNS